MPGADSRLQGEPDLHRSLRFLQYQQTGPVFAGHAVPGESWGVRPGWCRIGIGWRSAGWAPGSADKSGWGLDLRLFLQELARQLDAEHEPHRGNDHEAGGCPQHQADAQFADRSMTLPFFMKALESLISDMGPPGDAVWRNGVGRNRYALLMPIFLIYTYKRLNLFFL